MKNFCKTISKRALLGFMLLFASLTVVAQEITVTPGLSAGSSSVLAEENGIYYCVVEANGKIEYQITPAAGDTIVSAKWTVYKDGEVFTELDAKTTFSLAIDEVAYYSLAATVQFKNGKENTTVEFSEPSFIHLYLFLRFNHISACFLFSMCHLCHIFTFHCRC